MTPDWLLEKCFCKWPSIAEEEKYLDLIAVPLTNYPASRGPSICLDKSRLIWKIEGPVLAGY